MKTPARAVDTDGYRINPAEPQAAALTRTPPGGTPWPSFKNILETVGNTPVVRINKLAPPGANLFVKIEAFNPLGSVKDRLALGCHRGGRASRDN